VPLLRLVATLIAGLIRQGVATGSVSVSELLYNNSITRCNLSGNQCTPLCPQVTTDCSYRKLEQRFLTIGMLYVLTRVCQSRANEDKDFIYQVLTHKSLYELEGYDYYNPLDHVRKKAKPKKKSSKPIIEPASEKTVVASTAETFSKYEILSDLIKRLEEHSIEIAKEQLDKWFEEDDPDDIPDYVKFIRRETEKLKNPAPNLYSFRKYKELLLNFINNEIELSDDEVKSVIHWLVIDFVPRDMHDFPGVMQIDKIPKLIHDTEKLTDDHPCKWDKARFKKVSESDDPYEKVIYFNKALYAWKLYVVGKLRDVADWEVRYKELLDGIILGSTLLYSSKYVVFRKVTDNLKVVLQHLQGIAPVSAFLMDDQKNNLYQIDPTADIQAIRKKASIGIVELYMDRFFEMLLSKKALIRIEKLSGIVERV
jgi:hypothetical protein